VSIYLRAQVKGYGLVREVAEPFTFPGGEHHLNVTKEEWRPIPGYEHTGTQISSLGRINPGPGSNSPGALSDPVDGLRQASTVWIADVRGPYDADLTRAALLADVAHTRQAPFVLMLPYLPAARSDRGEPTGARVYANLVKAMNPQQVIGIDPHSTYITNYFEDILPGKLTVLDPVPLIQRSLNDSLGETWYDGVIAPDKGAVDRAGRAAEALGVDLYVAEKVRDFDTGAITSLTMPEKPPHSGRYLVVDDICDGGRTFNELAKVTELPRERLGLWVTHGIFSGHAPELRHYYEHIYTTDSHPGCRRVGVGAGIVPVEVYMLQNLKEDFQ
jgi:phosphoribosylpyrophosphate synthetase